MHQWVIELSVKGTSDWKGAERESAAGGWLQKGFLRHYLIQKAHGNGRQQEREHGWVGLGSNPPEYVMNGIMDGNSFCD